MKKDVLELTIEEFVRVLCGMEKTYTVYLKHFPITTNEKEREIVGTYSQIHDLFTDLSIANPENESARDALKYVEETLFDYGTELSDLDIYDYLEEKTKGFTQERCRIVLKEMEMYHSMYVDEERSSYVKEKIKNGWEEYKTIKIESVCDKPVTMIDYEDAYKKIYGFAYDFSYHYAINILQRKIGRSEIKNESITLPAELDSEQFRKYLGKAIEAGYVIINSNGCKWVYGGNRGQARLGYFCNKAFVRPRPIDKLEELFGVKRLSSSITSADSDAKRMDVILWRKEIDDMIFGD